MKAIIEIGHHYIDQMHWELDCYHMKQIKQIISQYDDPHLRIFIDDVHVMQSKLLLWNLRDDYIRELDLPKDHQIEFCFESDFISINNSTHKHLAYLLNDFGTKFTETFDRGTREQIILRYTDIQNEAKLEDICFPMYNVTADGVVPTCAFLSLCWCVYRYGFLRERFNCIDGKVITIVDKKYEAIERKVERVVKKLYSIKKLEPSIQCEWIILEDC